MEAEFEKLLNQEPDEAELRTDKNGLKYIPSATVERLLDLIYSNWGLQDFRFEVIKMSPLFVNASVTIHLKQKDGKDKFTTGCAMFPITGQDDNTNYSSIALSLAVCDAAKRLGRRFGRDLNGRSDTGDAIPSKTKPPADLIITQKYNIAVRNGRTEEAEELASKYSGLK